MVEDIGWKVEVLSPSEVERPVHSIAQLHEKGRGKGNYIETLNAQKLINSQHRRINVIVNII